MNGLSDEPDTALVRVKLLPAIPIEVGEAQPTAQQDKKQRQAPGCCSRESRQGKIGRHDTIIATMIRGNKEAARTVFGCGLSSVHAWRAYCSPR